MSKDEDLLLEDVTIEAVTAKAVLVKKSDGGKHWVPVSCIDLDETDVKFDRGETGNLMVKGWFAAKEGIEP